MPASTLSPGSLFKLPWHCSVLTKLDVGNLWANNTTLDIICREVRNCSLTGAQIAYLLTKWNCRF